MSDEWQSSIGNSFSQDKCTDLHKAAPFSAIQSVLDSSSIAQPIHPLPANYSADLNNENEEWANFDVQATNDDTYNAVPTLGKAPVCFS